MHGGQSPGCSPAGHGDNTDTRANPGLLSVHLFPTPEQGAGHVRPAGKATTPVLAGCPCTAKAGLLLRLPALEGHRAARTPPARSTAGSRTGSTG